MSPILMLAFAASIAAVLQRVAAGNQCAGGGAQGSLFLQAEMRHKVLQVQAEEQEVSNASRSRADDARFLMMASFGPTRQTLNELSQTSFEQWIQDQVQLPVESHREYYRLRVNPSYDSETEAGGYFTARSPCSRGSRWHRYALSQLDQWKTIEVRNGSVFVNGGFRTDVVTGALASRWSGLGDYTGYVCYVEEHVGGDVHLSMHPNCWSDKTPMPNPAVYVADGSKAMETSLPFSQLRPDTMLLGESALPCSFSEVQQERAEDSFIIKALGGYFAFDPRVELVENTAQRPAATSAACAPVTFLNEKSCRAQAPTGTAGRIVQGLLAEVHQTSSPSGFISEESTRPVTSFVHQEIDYSSTYDAWSQYFPSDYFAVQWKGNISIQQGGEYEFSITSDDGSQLYIDGVAVVNNGGNHGMAEKTGTVNLTAGNHSILIEYFEGGGHAGLVFSWTGPDSGNVKSVVPGSAFSTQVPSWSTECFLPCGSPGEVANDPSHGHLYSMYTTRDRVSRDFDNRFHDRMDTKLSKSTVWTAKALEARDQLRQRMAWALSQIFVVSSQGFGNNERTEMWLNYYDIFVRNAFGNFRDILQEVTYNPLMGRYLTNTGSTSHDYNQKFPNENYAREIMQLFTIGIEKLNVNGSIQKDVNGEDIPTYGMEDIMNFARVFTGFREQPRRSNIEYRGNDNLIDPLQMNWAKHDVHPKPDLDGNFLGDGYPLCDDTLPELFLAKGSKYEFLTYYFIGNAMELGQDSALYGALCAGTGGECSYPAAVTLSESLHCTGNECGAAGVKVVKVGSMYYSHSGPACVHHYFQAWPGSTTANFYSKEPTSSLCTEGTTIDDPAETVFVRRENEHCGGGSISTWATGEIADYGNSSYVNVTACQAICASHPECAGFYWRDSRQMCSYWRKGSLNRYFKDGYHCYEKVQPRCEEGVLAAFGAHDGRPWYGSSTYRPKGCSYKDGRMYFNIHPEGRKSSSYEPVCKAHVLVHEGGKVSRSGIEPNSFTVPWLEPAPQPGLHFISVEERPAFDRVPSKQELQRELKIAAYKPVAPCSVCDGEVKAYNPTANGSAITADSVFAVDGMYFRNVQRLLRTAGGQAFRSPPVFLRGQTGKAAEQAALAEVESLLDHLFQHENTPVFIGRRLIQRFGNSNPSAAYLEAVGNAFRQGHYGGITFSGKYGDLAATVAAVLLHEDARMDGPLGLQGSLREPILKMVHLMRSMEYEDIAHEQAIFTELQDVIGQFPYQSPTVFNFYLANFGFPMGDLMAGATSSSSPMPEPEPEPEPEPLVAPEMQIFTPPHFIGFLNGASSLIKNGVSYRCDGGTSLGIRSNRYDGLSFWETCPQGQMTVGDFGDLNETLDELDVLLTGGRLTPVAREVVRAAYVGAAPAERLQKAQQAILLTPEFHTLGEPLPKDMPRPEKFVPPPANQNPYKATVILFLAGGADTWNMLVPQQCNLYQEYLDVRTDLALSESDLIQVTVAGQPCDNFGIHGQFSFLKQLFDQQKALFFTNIGSLVEPTTKEQYKSNEVQRCVGLFSHSDQQTAAQTLQCQTMGNSPLGAGGRIADALASGANTYRVASFSLAGSAIFAQGVETNRQIVDEAGNRRFHEYELWREAISNITKQQHTHVFSEQYAKTLLDSIESTEDLGRAFEHVELATDYQTRSTLERQLEQVAKLIRVRDVRKAERDFFFVQVGGWDMHSNVVNGLSDKFADINRALQGFVAELQGQQVWDSVVLATTSEFARTLDSNGGGSDHAWGGQQFMIGGALKGGTVLNRFPTSLKDGGYNDLGRGRLIPEYPWESMMLPIAEWMGLDVNNQEVANTVFPNLKNFNSTMVKGADSVFNMA